MATAWNTFPIKFEGGWRTDLGRLDQGIQAPGSATILQNFELGIDGGYRKIRGYQKFKPEVVPGSGIINGVVVIDQSTALVSRDGSYYVSVAEGWQLVNSGAPTTERVRHTNYNFTGFQQFVLVDGLNPPAYYDPAGLTIAYDMVAPSEVIGAENVVVFKNHIFFSKNNILTFSAPYEPTNFLTGEGAGQINIGSPITGLIVFREQLIVFSTDKIQRIVGNTQADFVLQPIAVNTGCLSPDTVQEVGGDIMYLGPDGLRYLSATERNNDFGLQRASQSIQSEFNRIATLSVSYSSFVVRSKNQYRLFTFVDNIDRRSSEGFIGTKISDQSADNIGWSQIKGVKLFTADSRQFEDREVIFFSSEDSYLYQMEVGSSFDGLPIQAIFQTPYIPITDPRKRKTIYKHSIYTTVNGNFDLDVNLKFDYEQRDVIQPPTFTLNAGGTLGAVWGDANTVWGSFLYSTTLDEIFLRSTIGAGFTVALRYEDNSTNPSFNLDYAVLEYRENERR